MVPGDIAVITVGKEAAYGVCTSMREGAGTVTVIPDLESGNLADFATTERDEREITMALWKGVGYFAESEPESQMWRAHEFLYAESRRAREESNA